MQQHKSRFRVTTMPERHERSAIVAAVEHVDDVAEWGVVIDRQRIVLIRHCGIHGLGRRRRDLAHQVRVGLGDRIEQLRRFPEQHGMQQLSGIGNVRVYPLRIHLAIGQDK